MYDVHGNLQNINWTTSCNTEKKINIEIELLTLIFAGLAKKIQM